VLGANRLTLPNHKTSPRRPLVPRDPVGVTWCCSRRCWIRRGTLLYEDLVEMDRNFVAVAEATGRFLTEDYRFAAAKLRYTRSDELLRSVWFVPLQATKGFVQIRRIVRSGYPWN